MKITTYITKGSGGKTPISMNIALEKGFAVGTNEPYNLLDRILPEERLISIEPHEEFPELPDDIDIVFDLAGIISRDSKKSIISAVKQSDVVLVPIYNELKCIYAGIHTIQELLQYTDNIVVVATKLQKQKSDFFKDWKDSKDFQNIQSVITETIGKELPIFPLKFSKVFDTIFEKEMSINQMMQSSPLSSYTYREVGAQFDNLLIYLEENYAK